jgi:hypothetical protein
MDMLWLFKRALSQDEIFKAMQGEAYPYALSPSPEDGAYHEETWVTLSWSPGDFAVSHDVYMGDNFEDVDNGAGDTFRVNQTTLFYVAGFVGYAFPDGLVPGTTYYWRIDEVNEADPNSPWKGNIWSFTVPPKTAYGPNPTDGAEFVDPNATFSWTAGFDGKLHTVYIGTDFDDVNDATGGDDQGPTTDSPGTLELGKVYYWRVDEDDGSDIYKGDIWSFTVPPKTAYNPDPADGAEFVDPNAILSWMAGFDGKLHTVYIGTDFDDVNDATGGDDQGPTTYSPGTLELGKVYYWRVDEDDGSDIYKGDIWSFTTPGAVGSPAPSNGATDVKMTATLSWTPADNAASHEVYFGTDKDAVRNADKDSPEYKGPKALGAESYDPGKLSWYATYYWRVDEVDSLANLSKGPLWSFTTADFITVDDFEAYDTGDNQIWYAWLDGLGYGTPETPPYSAGNGTGSAVGDETTPSYCEEKIVHGGNKSMPVLYDNNKQGYSMYSEVELTLSEARDWTDEDVNELSLWFRGGSSNSADPLYVAVANKTGTPVVVVYDDPAASLIGAWTEWVIPLQTFAEKGIDLADVDRIMIGLGTRGNLTTPGGAGKMLFDDIRLNRLAEVAQE